MRQADLILVSVGKEDRDDFEDTRLHGVLKDYEQTEQWFVDWPQHPKFCAGLKGSLESKIDAMIAAEESKIKTVSSAALKSLAGIRETN